MESVRVLRNSTRLRIGLTAKVSDAGSCGVLADDFVSLLDLVIGRSARSLDNGEDQASADDCRRSWQVVRLHSQRKVPNSVQSNSQNLMAFATIP